MGLRGPTRRPLACRVAEGMEERNIISVRVRPGIPPKPEWLGEIASQVWDERIDTLSETEGLLAETYGPALALYCDAWQQFHDAKRIIDERGMVAISEKGAEYQHPAVGIKNKAAETIARLGAKFGMTPSDNDGIRPTTRTTEDELTELIA